MARLPRLNLPGCAQHVIQRGNNPEACFYAEADYKAYLAFLKEAAIRDATNKAWVLGDDRFKAQIEAKTGRRPRPLGRGGDRKSAEFRKATNQ